MRKHQGLGRLFVAVTALSLLIVTGGRALGALGNPPAGDHSHDLAALRVPAESSAKAGRAEALLERPKTQSDEAEARDPERHVLAAIERDMPITARPGGGKVVGTMPAGSRYFDTQHKAWILDRTENGRFGRVAVPYSGTRETGWIRLGGLELSRTKYSVRADLSRHVIVVKRFDKTIMRIRAATGAPGSPTPPGNYFVTDRVSIDGGGYLGSFAFGISGIQPNLPAGWSGGDQLAIHGTNDPGSIGKSSSAGCLRVSERALDRLKQVLRLGTPVIIKP